MAALAEQDKGDAQEEEHTREDTLGVLPYRVDTEPLGHNSRIGGEDILTFQHHECFQIASVLAAGGRSSTAWPEVLLEVGNVRVVQ